MLPEIIPPSTASQCYHAAGSLEMTYLFVVSLIALTLLFVIGQYCIRMKEVR